MRHDDASAGAGASPAHGAPPAREGRHTWLFLSQAERLRRFQWFLMAVAGFFAAGVIGAGVYAQRVDLLSQGIVVGVMAGLYGVSLRLARLGRIHASAAVTGGTLLAPLPYFVFLSPYLYPALALVPILATVIVFPVLSRRGTSALITGCAGMSLALVALGMSLGAVTPGSGAVPLGAALFALAYITVLTVLYTAIWHFSRELGASVAEVHRVNGELVVSHRRLEELDRMKSEFMNHAAHELNTPLTPIRLQVHMLNSGRAGALEPRQRRAVDLIDRNVERMARLVGDVLDAARGQAGRLVRDAKPLDLCATVDDAVESFRDPAHEAGVEVSVTHEAALPVVGDSRRVTQVLYNLITNALKFTPRGGSIHLRCFIDDGEAVVAVEDNGIGITAENVTRLFTPFTQVHDLGDRPRTGTGLGLYISRSIMHEHRGTLVATSDGLGHGTTFTLRMPLRDTSEDEAGAEVAGKKRQPRREAPMSQEAYDARMRQLI